MHALRCANTVGRAIVGSWLSKAATSNCGFTNSAGQSFPLDAVRAQRFHSTEKTFCGELIARRDQRTALATRRGHRCKALDTWVGNSQPNARAMGPPFRTSCQHRVEQCWALSRLSRGNTPSTMGGNKMGKKTGRMETDKAQRTDDTILKATTYLAISTPPCTVYPIIMGTSGLSQGYARTAWGGNN